LWGPLSGGSVCTRKANVEKLMAIVRMLAARFVLIASWIGSCHSQQDSGQHHKDWHGVAYYDDIQHSQCTLGGNCSDGGIPENRGFCARGRHIGLGNACWDVCNLNHDPESFTTSDTLDRETMSFAGMVETVRAGLNPMVRCPGLESGGDSCPPGEMCPEEMLTEFKILKGRGMCVIDAGQHHSRACWDMCDSRRNPQDYTMGTASGTAATVWAVRGSSVCPGTPWWAWALTVLGAMMMVTCGIGAFNVIKRLRKIRSRAAKEHNMDENYDDTAEFKKNMEEGSSDSDSKYEMQQDLPPQKEWHGSSEAPLSIPPQHEGQWLTQFHGAIPQDGFSHRTYPPSTGPGVPSSIPGLDAPNLLGHLPEIQAAFPPSSFSLPGRAGVPGAAPATVVQTLPPQVMTSFQTQLPPVYTVPPRQAGMASSSSQALNMGAAYSQQLLGQAPAQQRPAA